MGLALSSPAFNDGEPIPARYTCEGEDVSPPLMWSGVPEGTKSLALIVEDPDAPDPRAPKRIWVHWVLYNIPPSANGVGDNAAKAGLPPGTLPGMNDWKRPDYGGPCPPIGRHRYFFKLYALDAVLRDLKRPAKDALLTAMKEHVLAETHLLGTYAKQRN